MMELEGNAGQGSLSVRFYNRPTKNIVQDAVYLTMGCGQDATPRQPGQCSTEKFATIDRLFAEERIDGQPVGARNISNLNIGNSGLFLSGLYAKRPDVVALAVQQGQDIDVEKSTNNGQPRPLPKNDNASNNWPESTGTPKPRPLPAVGGQDPDLLCSFRVR